jgi:hypothetical protein
MNMKDSLSERATLEGIHGMLLAGEPHLALRRELSALLSPSNTLEQFCVKHARFRPGHKLRANFDAYLRAENGSKRTVRAMEATWRAPKERGKEKDKDKTKDKAKQAVDIGEILEEAIRRGVAAPFQQLVADLPALGVRVQISPLDAHFPQLVRLSDPIYVHEMLARVYSVANGSTSDALASRYEVQCIRYRPGRRHVLRYDPIDNTERGTVFAKAYAGDNAERSYRVAKSVAAWLKLNGKGVTSLEPLAYLPEDSVVLYPRLLGESLSQYLQKPHADKGQKLKSIGVALRAIHDLPPKVIGSLKPHDLLAEIKQVNRSIFHLPTLLPAAGSIVAAMLDRAKEINEKLPGESPVFTHGDFISEHIWATPNGLVLIDFDNCFLADPALDIGKLLADLHLLYANYNLAGVEEAQDAFLSGYCPGTPPERLIRARLYEAIKLAKMAGRRVYVFEADWASRTERLIDRAQGLLNDLELALGLHTKPSSLHQSLHRFEEGNQIV